MTALRCLSAILLFFAPAPPALAQLTPLAEGGARNLALGRASTALGGDVWGLQNPASGAAIQESAAGLFASQAFGLAELRVAAVAVAHPMPFGTLVGGARTYGFDDFREKVFGIGFARPIPVSATRHLHAGLALRHTSVSIPEFMSTGTLGVSAGLLVDLVPGLTFGASATNLNRPELSPADPLESRLDAGLAFRPHEQALVLAAVSKDIDFPLSVRAGLEVQPVEVLFLRAGFSTEPSRFSGGVGVSLGLLRADIAAEWHDVLGLTPAFELGVRW